MKKDIKKLEQLLNDKQNIAIFSHVNPDGDAVGASLAMQGILKNQGKNVRSFLLKKPESFLFLPGFSDIETEFDYGTYDLIIILDCSHIDRLDRFYTQNPKYFKKKDILVIDHHIPGTQGSGINAQILLQDPKMSSTCEYIFDLLYETFPDSFDKNVATQLLFGIYTDTGGFIHEKDSYKVFSLCLKLFEIGADKTLIIDKFVKGKTVGEIKALGMLIERIDNVGDILYSYYDIEELQKFGLHSSPKLGYSILQDIDDGYKALVIAKKDGDIIRCGMRSKGNINVQKVADYFGGGGHKYAAGFRIHLNKGENFKEKIKEILQIINNML